MRKPFIMLPLAASLFLLACATPHSGDSRTITHTQKSATISPMSGAALGTTINHKNRGKAALISAVGGGLAGASAGYYMDTQTKDLQRQLQAEIQRGEITIEKRNSDHAMLVSMTASTGFDNLSSVIKPGYISILNKISHVLNQHSKTLVTVIGYTDSIGPHPDNQRLSQRRAQAVLNYFARQNVNPLRLQAYGKGETEPRADNSTESGRQLNRRMEIWVQPVVVE